MGGGDVYPPISKLVKQFFLGLKFRIWRISQTNSKFEECVYTLPLISIIGSLRELFGSQTFESENCFEFEGGPERFLPIQILKAKIQMRRFNLNYW